MEKDLLGKPIKRIEGASVNEFFLVRYVVLMYKQETQNG
jgi:hypothetical protein